MNGNFKYKMAVIFNDSALAGTKIERFDVWRAKNQSDNIFATGEDENGLAKLQLPINNMM